ncbi:ergot alkaloid biosynthesis protein [Amycolatopsis sp. PS_44_ISF1]|uniref:ergot alkaloid biosynthesis protein n=1 Tax=Amycolatopsis sp. PS_44_ISF1 TaxID=2974917 RepID=UPI0028E8ED2D|nr:ergot alkaloid biosynthesis protein [Amycolatopsis sp. PS_44_ISF1]
MPEVLVLGSTGTTGGRVLRQLRRLGIPARAATRRPTRPGQVRFDWADRATHAEALDRVTAVYLVAPIGVAEPRPLVEPFLTAAPAARVVLLSSSAVDDTTPGLGELHGLVRRPPGWAILRPSWFMQNFTGEHVLAQQARRGEIVTATGEARVGFVDATDIAAVAVHALTDAEPHSTEHVLTGPAASATPKPRRSWRNGSAIPSPTARSARPNSRRGTPKPASPRSSRKCWRRWTTTSGRAPRTA